MKRVLFPVLTLTLLLFASLSTEARADDDPTLAAMQALSSLEGRWEGRGWSRRGPAEPKHFTSIELVESRLDGRALIVEGLHYDAEDRATVVHHALAMITYDAEAGRYDFRSYVAGRSPGNFEGKMVDGAFVWGFEMRGRGHMRYTIRFENDTWHEIGEFSADGSQWSQFFQMDLERVAE